MAYAIMAQRLPKICFLFLDVEDIPGNILL